MNLLSLIIVFLALVICGAIAFIAWELTSESPAARKRADTGTAENRDAEEPGETDPTRNRPDR